MYIKLNIKVLIKEGEVVKVVCRVEIRKVDVTQQTPLLPIFPTRGRQRRSMVGDFK
jgi:hypothetical protein